MPRPPPIAAFMLNNGRKIALVAFFLSAVVLSVSFVANSHGVNRLALEQRGIRSHHDVQMAGKSLGRPSLQAIQGTLDDMAKDDTIVEGSSRDSLEEAQKFVDKYAPGSFGSIPDSPAAPAVLAASDPLLVQSNQPIGNGDSLSMAPPLSGSIQPAYTSLSSKWNPFPSKPSREELKSKDAVSNDKGQSDASSSGSSSDSSSSKCFDVKDIKIFLPPGFGKSRKGKKGSDPFDKLLKKAELPTFGEIKDAVKCVPSIVKSLKAATRSPKSVLSALKTIDKCMSNLADIADKCQSSPGMMAISAAPKVGPMVSYVCGLASKMVDKYMYIKNHVGKGTFQCSLKAEAVDPHAELFLAQHAVNHPSEPVVSYHELLQQLEESRALQVLAAQGLMQPPRQALLAVQSELAAQDPISKVIDKLLKKAQLPTLKDLIKIVECIKPVGKGLKKLVGKPSLAAADAVFKNMDGCMCRLDKLSQQCEGPAVMVISSQDPVGQVVGYVCAMAAKAVAKYTVIRDYVRRGKAVVSLVQKAALSSSSFPQLSSSPIKKIAQDVKKGVKKVGNAIKNIGNPLDMGLKKAGLPTSKEMGKIMKCAVKFTKDFHALAKAPDSSTVLRALGRMDGCIAQLADLSEKCDGPAVMAASMVPMGVGNAVSTVCSTASSVVEKYRNFRDGLDAAGFSRPCPANSGNGQAGKSKASKSKASKSKASKSKASKSKASKSKASKSKAGKSKASKSKASKSKASKSKAGKSKAGKSKAGKSKARKDKARKSKARKDKARKSKVGKSRASRNNSVKSAPSPPAVIFRQDRGGMIESYSPPWNLYLLWTPSMQNTREYYETSMTSSEFVRRALRLGSRAETGSIDPHESHFLTGGFDSPKFTNDLANTCCSVIVAPPFENGFDVYSPADKTEARIQQVSVPALRRRLPSPKLLMRVVQRLRDFVANGNSIVVTGGIMSQIFLNRNFLTQLEPVSGNYDDGPFRLNIRFQKATATRRSQFNRLGFDVLEQMGHNVYAIESRSLPPQSRVVFNSMDGGVVVAIIPYCQGFPTQYDNSQSPVSISADRCEYLKAKSRRLGRTRPDQAPCSCGSLVYLGFDYSDFSDMPSDVHRWVKVLRAAAATTWGKDQGREDSEILNTQRNFQ